MSYNAYPPPYPVQPHYAPLPPPPHQLPIELSHQLDPFRGYYAGRLRELTFNSRPIIQDLSMLAMHQRDQHNWANMRSVVEELEGAILQAPPHGKLPLLYLLDSISKNIGPPYTTDLLPPIIPRLYMRTYREVDGVTKAKMEEMINLWRTGGPGGTDLYGPSVREAVEKDIFGSTGAQTRQPYPTQQRVQQLLQQTMEGKQRELAARPWDQQPAQQIGILVQLRQLLHTTSVPPPELQNIQDQLIAMQAAAARVQPPLPPPLTVLQAPIPQPIASWVPPPSLQSPTLGHLAPLPPFLPSVPTQVLQTPTYPTPPPGGSTPLPQAPTPVPPLAGHPVFSMPAGVADILKNLNTSGLLSKSQTPDITSMPIKIRTALDDYENLILAMRDIDLNTLDLSASHPSATSFPLDHLPQRCKQCGVRYPDGDERMQEHLDWHFRRNRKERETEGRGAHRRWLPRGEEWVSDVYISARTDGAGSSGIPGAWTSAGGAQAGGNAAGRGQGEKGKLTAEKLGQLKKKWVRVPSDPAQAAEPCPICKETLKSEWSEDEEEWIFRNALNVNGKIYHATCRAEQMSLVVAARLIGGDGSRRTGSKSPRSTPGVGGEGKPSPNDINSPPTIINEKLADNPSKPMTDMSTPVKLEEKDGRVTLSLSEQPLLGQLDQITDPSRSDLVNGSCQSDHSRAAEEEANLLTLNEDSAKRKAGDEGDGHAVEEAKRVKLDVEDPVNLPVGLDD